MQKGTRNLLIFTAIVAVAGTGVYLYTRHKAKAGKDEKKSNAIGTQKTVGPCEGRNATDANCQAYCEDKLNGTYNSSDRTCTYGGSMNPGPMFGGARRARVISLS